MTSSQSKVIKKHQHGILRFAYDEALTSSARLASYSTSNLLLHVGYGDYLERANELAHADMVRLAISVRRLSEIADLSNLLAGLKVNSKPSANWKDQEKENESQIADHRLGDILNRIIHCKTFILSKQLSHLKLYARRASKALRLEECFDDDQDIPAICLVESDRPPPKLFAVHELVTVTIEFLDEAKEALIDSDVLPPDI
jgi:hypothetical protein